MLREWLGLSTGAREAIVDVTAGVREAVQRDEVHNGVVIANYLHTTCLVLSRMGGGQGWATSRG